MILFIILAVLGTAALVQQARAASTQPITSVDITKRKIEGYSRPDFHPHSNAVRANGQLRIARALLNPGRWQGAPTTPGEGPEPIAEHAPVRVGSSNPPSRPVQGGTGGTTGGPAVPFDPTRPGRIRGGRVVGRVGGVR